MLRRAKPLFHKLLGSAILMGMLGHQAVADEVERWQVNMTPGVTPVSQEIYGLHMLIFWICVAISVIVFGALAYTIYAHRRSKNREPSTFHEHLGLEIFWTAIPFLILVVMAIPATRSLIHMYDTDTEVDLDVVVTGYQWKWQYEYLGKEVSFFSNLHEDSNAARQLGSGVDVNTIPNYLLEVDRPLVVPVKQKIRFLVTANDVIHAWWVPALGIKRDAIPGFVRESWAYIEEPGIYRGVCAELCGRDHGFMPIVVQAVEQAEFNEWIAQEQAAAAELRELAAQTFTFEDLYERGEGVYNRSCAACHGAQGQGVPGAFPAIAGSAVATGPLEAHLDVVLNGVPGTAMQAFGAQLSPVDIAAVVTFQRNAFGNNMGDQVQPVDVVQQQNQ
ncbi:cytochrome c oxidase subunit II [Proteobacteria bacterium 005FR1]|nr:cytochrome c oxidase subunit II [Proteobacteria bacterium 005FR1]